MSRWVAGAVPPPCVRWLGSTAIVATIRTRPASPRQALDMARAPAEPRVEALALHILGIVERRTGTLLDALSTARTTADRYIEADITVSLAEIDEPAAPSWRHAALSITRQCGYLLLEGRTLAARAAAEYSAGDVAAAWRSARLAAQSHAMTGHQPARSESKSYSPFSCRIPCPSTACRLPVKHQCPHHEIAVQHQCKTENDGTQHDIHRRIQLGRSTEERLTPFASPRTVLTSSSGRDGPGGQVGLRHHPQALTARHRSAGAAIRSRAKRARAGSCPAKPG